MALKFVLDTSAYSAFFRGENSHLRKFFTSDNQIVVPTIVLGELRAGFAHGNKKAFNKQNLEKFLNSPNVDTVSISDQTTNYYATIFASLKSVGKPIGTNDMWIGAICLEHRLGLLTLDADFSNISVLKIIKF